MRCLGAILLIGYLCIIDPSNEQFLVKDDEKLPRVVSSVCLLLKAKQLPAQENKVDIIQDFITDKLRLPHLRWKVLQAKVIDSQGILFEMASADEGDEILKQAKLLLNQDIFDIEPAGDLDLHQLGFSVGSNFDKVFSRS